MGPGLEGNDPDHKENGRKELLYLQRKTLGVRRRDEGALSVLEISQRIY
jgi:hypothetical protein